MKFQIGDRIRYFYSTNIGIVVDVQLDNVFTVNWDQRKYVINGMDGSLILVESSFYSDFLDKIKDRLE